jgi:hypothetical protein
MSATTIAVAVKPDTLATDFPAEIGLVMRAFVSACGITGAAGSNSTFDSLCPRTNDWHGGAAKDAIESPGLLPKLCGAVNGDQNFKSEPPPPRHDDLSQGSVRFGHAGSLDR